MVTPVLLGSLCVARKSALALAPSYQGDSAEAEDRKRRRFRNRILPTRLELTPVMEST